MADISIDDQLRCMRRVLLTTESRHAGWVRREVMSQDDSDGELNAMRAIPAEQVAL